MKKILLLFVVVSIACNAGEKTNREEQRKIIKKAKRLTDSIINRVDEADLGMITKEYLDSITKPWALQLDTLREGLDDWALDTLKEFTKKKFDLLIDKKVWRDNPPK